MTIGGMGDAVLNTEGPGVALGAEEHPQLFNAVGQQASHLNEQEDADDTERPVEEIESLCMNCGANVSFEIRTVSCLADAESGHDETTPYQNPLLPRACHHVLRVSVVRLPE